MLHALILQVQNKQFSGNKDTFDSKCKYIQHFPAHLKMATLLYKILRGYLESCVLPTLEGFQLKMGTQN